MYMLYQFVASANIICTYIVYILCIIATNYHSNIHNIIIHTIQIIFDHLRMYVHSVYVHNVCKAEPLHVILGLVAWPLLQTDCHH